MLNLQLQPLSGITRVYPVQARYEFYIIVGNYIRLPRDLAILIARLNYTLPLIGILQLMEIRRDIIFS